MRLYWREQRLHENLGAVVLLLADLDDSALEGRRLLWLWLWLWLWVEG